jgi:hypothetical protein
MHLVVAAKYNGLNPRPHEQLQQADFVAAAASAMFYLLPACRLEMIANLQWLCSASRTV